MSNFKRYSKIFLIVAALIAIFILFRVLNIPSLLTDLLTWIEKLGVLAPVFFVLFYILACVFFIPGSLLTLGAGFIFGVLKGSILVSIGSTLGATLCFLIGRYVARTWVASKVETKPKFKAIDEGVGREGWKIVGLTRLSPAFPFILINYGYGITKVSLRDYFFASWIGMMPGTVMYVYFGSLAGELATLGASREKSAVEWTLYAVGFLATVIVTIYVTKIAKNALSERVS